MTPIEFDKYCQAYTRRQKVAAETQDALNYLLGQYVGLASRAPKKYPSRPLLSKTQKEVAMQPITDDLLLKTATSLGAKINVDHSR